MSTAQLSPGTVVDAQFQVGAAGPARQGACSYAATDRDGQAVVLTAYDASCFPSGLVLERSLRELRQLQAVNSRRVASVLACGKLPQGGIYEVNGPLPPQRLDDVLANGPLEAADAAALVEHVGGALLEAQKAGVIHRNLGPRVVFVSDTEIVVAGFAVGEPHGGKSRGPLDTIAPEQIEGKVVDQRTLIYNLAALMHMLLTGGSLYPGDAATQLPMHLAGTLPEGVHARLRRALGPDPRMRPMMLKQFLTDLRAIAGGAGTAPRAPSIGQAPAAAGGPSSRGWTMFMKAEDSQAPASPKVAPPVDNAPAAKPKTRGWTMFMEAEGGDAQAGAAAEPAPPETPAKPKTRGWTMFMEAEEGAEGAGAEAKEQAPAPAAAPAAEGSPRTRGWTMFMEGDEDAAAEPAAEAAAEAPAPAPASPAPTVGEAAPKPSTRGWTMFMKADESDEAKAAAAPAVSAPSAPSVPTAPAVSAPRVPSVSAPQVPAAPSVAAPPTSSPSAVFESSATVPVAAKAPAVPSADPAGGPKSRGWTMFTESVDDGAAAPVAEAPVVAPTPEPAAPVQAAASAPTRREPGADLPPYDPGAADVTAQPPVEAEPAAAAPSGGPVMPTPRRRSDSEAPNKKRGWTMFMEKPIDDASPEQLGGAAEPGESDAKGWTVFQPAADPGGAGLDPDAVAEVAREAPPPAVSGQTVVGGAPPSSSGTVVSTAPPHEAASGHPSADTVPVTEPPRPGLAPPGNRPKTMVTPPGSGPGALPLGVPDAGPPSGPVTGPLSGPVSGPVSVVPSGPLSGPVSGPMSHPSSEGLVHTGPRAVVPAAKGNRTVVIVAVGVLVLAAVAVVVWLLSN
ncbi:MAG: hypothetical protein K0V04_20315 [Deltaproteobacteria bacterium]|nr:hypothetical protein [Deltaproteobacteria bacterium]